MPFVPDQPSAGRFVPDGAAAPAQPSLEAQGQAMAAEDTPEWERRMIGATRGVVGTPADALQQLVGHLTGRGKDVDAEVQERARAMQALERASAKDTASRPNVGTGGIMGGVGSVYNLLNKANAGRLDTASGAVEGAALPVAKVPGLATKVGPAAARVLTGGLTGGAAAAANPVTSGGDFGKEKAKQVGEGAATGGALSGIFEGLSKIPGLARAWGAAKATPERPAPSGAADEVAAETQRQRDVMGGQDAVLAGQKSSPYELAKLELDTTTKPLREAAFKSSAKVGTAGALKALDAVEGSAVNAGELAALKEARATIQRGVKNTGGSPELVQTSAGPMVLKGNKLVPYKASADLSVEQADEVRQSLKAQIDATGEKALGPDTKRRLMGVVKALEGDARTASPEYAKLMDAERTLRSKMDKFDPSKNVLGKITSELRAGRPLTGKDAQDALASVFGGKTRERDLQDLMDFTKNDPSAQKALRKSLGEYLTGADPETKVVSTKNLASRWEGVRGAAVKTGLMQADHAKNVDSLVDDLIKLKGKKGMGKDVATIGGFFAGMPIGHPFMVSHFARDMAGKTDPVQMQKQATDIIMALAVGDQATAAMLAKPPTSANMSEFAQRVSQMLSVSGGRAVGAQTPARKRPEQGALPVVPQ